ncbi:hypothetical protein BA896_014765 [Janthinobacterium lividum]|uniref:Uncharacterized protein n=1 Tax=Janthinobacterium lividum TaxID=29581 RepID=A0A1E8PUC1_9BURK|nr:hypothetical protein BA896_014765 [Janthinobacterium lividum]
MAFLHAAFGAVMALFPISATKMLAARLSADGKAWCLLFHFYFYHCIGAGQLQRIKPLLAPVFYVAIGYRLSMLLGM